MTVTPGEVQVPPDGTGKKIDNVVVTTAAGTVYRQAVAVADAADPAGYVAIKATAPGGADYGIVTRPIAPATLPLPTGASQDGTDGATPPSIPGTGIRGWLRSIYDRLGGTLATSRTWTLGSGTDSVSVTGTVTTTAAHLNSATDSVTTVPSGTTAVSATSLPLPAGASTETTLALIKAKTDNLDVAISTRTKPADTQTTSNTTDKEYTHVPFTASLIGDNDIYTPTTGKAVRIHWVSLQSDPGAATTPLVKVKIGTLEVYRLYVVQKQQQKTGAVNDHILINLSAAVAVSGTIILEEV